MHVKLIYSSSNKATRKGLARKRPWAGSGSTLIRLHARATTGSVGHDRNVSTTNNAAGFGTLGDMNISTLLIAVEGACAAQLEYLDDFFKAGGKSNKLVDRSLWCMLFSYLLLLNGLTWHLLTDRQSYDLYEPTISRC